MVRLGLNSLCYYLPKQCPSHSLFEICLLLRAFIFNGQVARRMGLGPESRIDMLRNILTGLVRDETTETTRARADEDRFYDEKLTDYAKRGDTNEKSMKMADFWLTEKNLIPKRFKVLALRFENQTSGYTRMAHIPNRDNLDRAPMAVLEYKGNTFPPLFPVKRVSELNLLNQLLTGYREENAQMVAESKDI
ncbi:39S ribosomal protein L17, mitochondrial-like [Myxocyprinus asiaticus]|uniref:39S ribosomal protein L17, mitochondrial-like n=1 Tax=Myxocyprinus asiaticus TaxID=70543 RepID=UPI0022214103|nr:39S ribosomal protein L17, mitochondrial-like [Myxocyprinus asiaticus]